MNTYYFNDENFKNTDIYKEFMSEYLGEGGLKVRAYAAREALPIEGLNVIISTTYKDDKIIFFEGKTNASGVIEKMSLPAPILLEDNLDAPKKLEYEIEAIYVPDNVKETFKVNLYNGICVVQNINLVPDMNMDLGEI